MVQLRGGNQGKYPVHPDAQEGYPKGHGGDQAGCAMPDDALPGDQQRGYLTTLVIFHCVTIVLITLALWIRTRQEQ